MEVRGERKGRGAELLTRIAAHLRGCIRQPVRYLGQDWIVGHENVLLHATMRRAIHVPSELARLTKIGDYPAQEFATAMFSIPPTNGDGVSFREFIKHHSQGLRPGSKKAVEEWLERTEAAERAEDAEAAAAGLGTNWKLLRQRKRRALQRKSLSEAPKSLGTWRSIGSLMEEYGYSRSSAKGSHGSKR